MSFICNRSSVLYTALEHSNAIEMCNIIISTQDCHVKKLQGCDIDTVCTQRESEGKPLIGIVLKMTLPTFFWVDFPAEEAMRLSHDCHMTVTGCVCFLPVGVVVPYMMCSDMFQQNMEESRYLLCCSEGMCVWVNLQRPY